MWREDPPTTLHRFLIYSRRRRHCHLLLVDCCAVVAAAIAAAIAATIAATAAATATITVAIAVPIAATAAIAIAIATIAARLHIPVFMNLFFGPKNRSCQDS